MKCNGCGQQFPAQEATFDTRSETIGKGCTPLKPMTLCADCAASRRNTFWFVLWAVLFLLLGIAFVSLLNS
jgi:hypothetical protein